MDSMTDYFSSRIPPKSEKLGRRIYSMQDVFPLKHSTHNSYSNSPRTDRDELDRSKKSSPTFSPLDSSLLFTDFYQRNNFLRTVVTISICRSPASSGNDANRNFQCNSRAIQKLQGRASRIPNRFRSVLVLYYHPDSPKSNASVLRESCEWRISSLDSSYCLSCANERFRLKILVFCRNFLH